MVEPDETRIEERYQQLKRNAESSGYHLNPDEEFTRELVKGLLANEDRYGYPSCPCRLASGDAAADRDIVCPCDYRDPDIGDHGACYCALYVNEAIAKGEAKARRVPERRPVNPEERRSAMQPVKQGFAKLPVPVWRCQVCGYLCGREKPPEVCPICKAKQERFEKFIE